MFGYEPGELVGQSIDMLVPHPVRERHVQHRRAYAHAPKLRTMGAGLALRGRRRDGSEFPIDVLLKPRDAHPGSATIAIVRDMTDRQNLEDALRQARDSAVQANEVKSRFLAAASHDLRQPLQTIWSLQAVLSRAFKKTEYGPHLALLEEAVRIMDQTLSSLVDINRLEKGAIQPVIRDFPLREILPRLRSEFSYAASSKFLELDIEDTAEFARSDPMLLPVILRNLIGNAIKYTQAGSVRVRIRPQAAQLAIDIIDTGPGIPAEHLERLFDAFYQIGNTNRDQRQGVGLGLSIVQTICRLLDHTVTIDSREGTGSTFTLQLARGEVAEPVPEVTAPAASVTATLASALKVLHIEDDPGVARSMAMLLRVEGYEVIGAASRDEALRQVGDGGVRPDLILCDFQLPMGFTGDEIVAEIAALLKSKPPTIMLTGDISDQHVEKARLIADRILPKPVDITVLLREMQDLLDKRQ
jgi:PAS domain S-box-containing protein